jgi:hypothetical protein
MAQHVRGPSVHPRPRSIEAARLSSDRPSHTRSYLLAAFRSHGFALAGVSSLGRFRQRLPPAGPVNQPIGLIPPAQGCRLGDQHIPLVVGDKNTRVRLCRLIGCQAMPRESAKGRAAQQRCGRTLPRLGQDAGFDIAGPAVGAFDWPAPADENPLPSDVSDQPRQVDIGTAMARPAVHERLHAPVVELPDRVHCDRVCDRLSFSHSYPSQQQRHYNRGNETTNHSQEPSRQIALALSFSILMGRAALVRLHAGA